MATSRSTRTSSAARARRGRPVHGRSRRAALVSAIALVVLIPFLALGSGFLFGPAPRAAAGGIALHVRAHRLVDADGHDAILHGVDRMGTEYMCAQGRGIFEGPTDQASIDALTRWGVNAVRLPLNEHCWLGLGDVVADYGGAAYRDAIVAYARSLVANGIYVIVDLHWSAPGDVPALGAMPMPDADHAAAFW